MPVKSRRQKLTQLPMLRTRPTHCVRVAGFVLKEQFLCALYEASQNSPLCDTILPADQSAVLLGGKQMQLLFSAAGRH